MTAPRPGVDPFLLASLLIVLVAVSAAVLFVIAVMRGAV